MEWCFLCETKDEKRSLCSSCAKIVIEGNKNLVQTHKRSLNKIKTENLRLRELIKAQLEQHRSSITVPVNINTNNITPPSSVNQASLSYLSECISQDREEINIKKQNLQARRRALDKARKDLTTIKHRFQELSLPKHNEHLSSLQEQCTSELVTHRRTLIAELLSFLPMNPSPTSEKDSIIINIILPNSGVYSSYPPATLSAALGYIAHHVQLVSSYLQVVLPYHLVYAGARSVIHTNDDPPRLYPLYGARTSDMEGGLALLNRNIVYLCASQGIKVPRNAHAFTLSNMMALLRSPTMGWPVPFRDTNSNNYQIYKQQLPLKRILQHRSSVVVLTEEEEENEEDFIVLDHSVPTPSQAEELAHFERAMFIDRS